MMEIFRPLNFAEDLRYVIEIADFVDNLQALKSEDTDITAESPMRSPPASSPIDMGVHIKSEGKRKKRNIEEHTGIFHIEEQLKLQQRKSYFDETRYLNPNPVIMVRHSFSIMFYIYSHIFF